MSGLDGALIDEATAGINAPANGDQNAIVRVDNAQPPDPPNLRYQSLDSFLQEMAPLIFSEARTESHSEDGSVVATGNVFSHEMLLTEGFASTILVVASVEDGGVNGLEFYESQRVVVQFPEGGVPTLATSQVVLNNSNSDYSLTVEISGDNLKLKATVENLSVNSRGVDIAMVLELARPIPAPP